MGREQIKREYTVHPYLDSATKLSGFREHNITLKLLLLHCSHTNKRLEERIDTVLVLRLIGSEECFAVRNLMMRSNGEPEEPNSQIGHPTTQPHPS